MIKSIMASGSCFIVVFVISQKIITVWLSLTLICDTAQPTIILSFSLVNFRDFSTRMISRVDTEHICVSPEGVKKVKAKFMLSKGCISIHHTWCGAASNNMCMIRFLKVSGFLVILYLLT